MANADRPTGLTPIGHLLGCNWTSRTGVYCVPQTDDTNVFAIGDPVVLDGGADSNGIPTVTLATAGTGNPVLGAFVGLTGVGLYTGYGSDAADPSAPNTIILPATKTKDYYIIVTDDPFIIYEMQEDSDGGNIAAASIGLNVNLIPGTNNGYFSGWELDSSSVASGATLQAKLLRVRQMPAGLNALGTNCKFEILLNNHPFKAGVAGI